MRKKVLVVLATGFGFVACSGLSSWLGGCGNETTYTHAQESPEHSALRESKSSEWLYRVAASAIYNGRSLPTIAASVKEFYEETGFTLGWIRNGKPTAQALELIRILEAAEMKGLQSKDYDGSRWPDRVKALQSGSGVAETGRVRFDVALTVLGTRYISDLHLGKVDPENCTRISTSIANIMIPGPFSGRMCFARLTLRMYWRKWNAGTVAISASSHRSRISEDGKGRSVGSVA